MLILQILASALLVLNKWHVYKDRAKGWIYGIWGTVAITLYFYLQMILEHKYNLWIMVVYDVALLPLMGYGFMVASAEKDSKQKVFLERWDLWFKLSVAVIAGATCTFMYIELASAGLTKPQFIMSLFGLGGTVALALNSSSIKLLGWIAYLSAHVIVVYVTLETDSPFLALGQIFSAYIALLAIKQKLMIRA